MTGFNRLLLHARKVCHHVPKNPSCCISFTQFGNARTLHKQINSSIPKSLSTLTSSHFSNSGNNGAGKSRSFSGLSSAASALAIGLASMSAVVSSTNGSQLALMEDIPEDAPVVEKTQATAIKKENEITATAIATSTAFGHLGPPPGIRQLGNAIAEMHEKQKVLLGRMLHDLNQLAEEAISRANGDVSRKGETLNEDEGTVHLPEELEKLSPQEAWRIIDELREIVPPSEGHTKVVPKVSRANIKRILATAAQLLQKEPTVVDLREREDLEMVTVVGDLHGQFDSLLDVFQLVGCGFGPKPPKDEEMLKVESGKRVSGTPWDGSGAVIFNGDFVDRGENSLGVLLALLLLKIAFPNHLYLNRGNHEDDLLSTVYGFTEELESLYGTKEDKSVDDIWEVIGDVFAALPICTCTPSAVIMHGGLPSEDFSLDELRAITSEARCQVKSVLEPEGEPLKELLQKVLWSDPRPDNGIMPNEDRGAGVVFGPDVTKNFLSREGFQYLIRSHEPVDMGYEQLDCEDESAGAVTIFSAAKYPAGEGYNWGAVIRLNRGGGFDPVFFPGSEGTNQEENENEDSYTERAFNELSKVIARKSSPLLSAFREMAKLNEYANSQEPNELEATTKTELLVTQEQWANVMSQKLDLQGVNWLELQPYLATTVKKKNMYDGKIQSIDMIDCFHFLNLHCNASLHLDRDSTSNLHQNQSMLLNVFKFLDSDGSGQIDKEEFRVGIELLNKRSQEQVVEDPDILFDTIDVDGDGELDIEEFESAFQASSTPYHIACFKKFDIDNSGLIDREEFHLALSALNEHLPTDRQFDISEANKVFDRLDLDESGDLDMEEFQQLLREVGYLPRKV